MQSLSSVLYSLYRGTPQHGEWVVACLQGAWAGLVGESIASVCKPARWVDSKLWIEVADAAWVGALESVRGEMLDRICKATSGEVRGISFSLTG